MEAVVEGEEYKIESVQRLDRGQFQCAKGLLEKVHLKAGLEIPRICWLLSRSRWFSLLAACDPFTRGAMI